MTGKPNRYAIVGMKHRGAEEFVASLPPDAPVALIREPNNRFDRNAVQVWAYEGENLRHVGYVPKTQNAGLAKFIDEHGSPRTETVGTLGVAMDANPNVKFVAGRLHKGNNTYPLVEIV